MDPPTSLPAPKAAPPPLLHVDGLVFGHRGRALGQPLSLDVAAGEILAVLGPNGCGKTTFFRSLLGLIPALAGRVSVAGQWVLEARAGARAKAPPDRARLARHVAYVPQAHAGVFAYAVLDVVLMGRAVHLGPFALPGQRDRAAAQAALARLGIDHLAARPYTELSGGERQLVLIARALAQQTPVLVLDEPTAALDFGNQRRVLREIGALKGQGVAVLMSTHQPEHALRTADRVALMGAGRLQALGPAAATLTPTALATLYGVPEDEVLHSVPGLADVPAPKHPGARP